MLAIDRVPLIHLDRMTDSTGLTQHAIYSVPRRESGYTTDDNARALRLCTRLYDVVADERMLSRVSTYLSFLEHARCPGRGFHNYLGYDRRWLDAEGCGDCQGQAVRSLAEVLGSRLPDDYQALARELIDAVLPALADLRSLRAQAYIILAWGRARSAGAKNLEPLENVAWSAAHRLVECNQRCRRPGWEWFEAQLTYANAVLPHALCIAAERWPNEPFLEVAQCTFGFLERATIVDDVFLPIGNRGWFSHGEDKALYDQQPVEAATMAEAALAAYKLLADDAHLATYRRARDWFQGANSLGQSLVDFSTGGCFDGLHESGVNRNQGAESTLAFLWTEVLEAEQARAQRDGRQASVA